MSMTREELQDAIDIVLTDYMMSSEGERAEVVPMILALFDRYEREQWSKPGESPSGKGRDVLVHDDRETSYSPSVELWWSGKRWSKHWRFRELPKGPNSE